MTRLLTEFLYDLRLGTHLLLRNKLLSAIGFDPRAMPGRRSSPVAPAGTAGVEKGI